jgi:hypothetical protein
MATQWTREESTQRWLFTDGTIATPPAVEVTGSRRRFRPEGSKESFPIGSLHSSLIEALKAKAASCGTELWMPLSDRDEQFGWLRRDYFPENIALDLSQEGELVRLTWFLKHAENVYGHFTLILNKNRYRTYWEISMEAKMLDTSRITSGTGASRLEMDYNNFWGEGVARYDSSYDSAAVRTASQEINIVEFLHAIGYLKEDLRSTNSIIESPIEAVKALLTIASRVEEEIDKFVFPVYRDGATPTVGHVTIDYTNFTERIRNELKEIVDTNGSLDAVRATAVQLIKQMRKVGMVVDVDESRLFSLNPDALSVLDAQLLPQDGDGDQDHEHKVYVNIVSGACRVVCGKGDAETYMEAGSAWEVAKFRAELTGELDELLTYAQQHVKQNQMDKIELASTMPVEHV